MKVFLARKRLIKVTGIKIGSNYLCDGKKISIHLMACVRGVRYVLID